MIFFEIEYLRKGTTQNHSYYRTSTSLTPNPGFKVMVFFEEKNNRKPYLKYRVVPCLVTLSDL